jgi:hypothetical protein
MGLLDFASNCVSSAVTGLGHVAGEALGSAVGAVAGQSAGKIVGDLVERAASSGSRCAFDHLDNMLNLFKSIRSGGFGKIAEDVLGAVLPEQLKPLKDLVGIAVNLSTGNYPAVILEGLELLHNLPQLCKELSNLSPNLSPSAPPTGSAAQGSTSAGSSSSTPNTETTSQTDATSSAAGTSSTASSDSTGQTKETKGQAAAQKFLASHSDPEDFIKQIRSGTIPEDVLNSQAGMMMIQERLQSIQQMNQLMTQMLKSMHDMSMAIVQNVRV